MIPSKIRGAAAPLKVRLWLAMLFAVTLVAAAADAKADDEFRLFPASPPRPRYFSDFRLDGEQGLRIVDLEHSYPWSGGGRPDLGIGAAAQPETGDPQEQEPPPEAAPPPPPKKLFTTGTTLWTAGALLGGVLQGIGAPLQYGLNDWKFTDEKWFQYDTYAGGADKASHFIVSSGVSRLLFDVYQIQGHTVDQSFNLALAATVMAGIFVETGDAITVYGWSWQDLTADILGATSGLLIHRYHLQDLIGLRLGSAYVDIPAAAIGSSEPSLGRSYSDEIYVADLKLGGLVRRLHGDPGFAKYFLTSFAFFTKGFGYAPPLPTRYQEVGVELGINFGEIAKAVGVPETTWWGKGIYAFFNFFRIPYTQVGAYYNFKNHKWYGPGAPYHYYSY
jgi:uncharacterized protein YfiM (DUF2279 family)